MSKKIALFCALIGVIAFVATPAYAEVQNIKVSGDIRALAIYRNNYDLEDKGWTNPLATGLVAESTNQMTEDEDSLFMSIARLRVDADLTDNVSACVRIANLREWDVANAAEDDIVIDLAYVTLKEMLYSPLTLVVGRQELNYGNGLIVGPGRYQNPNGVTYPDLSTLHGYDAVRAILDYDPWTMDLLMAKITETDDAVDRDIVGVDDGAGRHGDEDLYGVNIGYRFSRYDAEMEGYCFFKDDNNWNYRVDTVDADGNLIYSRRYEENDVYTIGLRGSAMFIDNLTLGAEVAGQLFGGIVDDGDYGTNANLTTTTSGNDIGGDTGASLERDREAMLAYIMGKYDFVDVRFKPYLELEYLYLSGDEATAETGDYEVWDQMYRGKIMGTIRDCLETFYATNDNLDTGGWENQHTAKASMGLDLSEFVDGLKFDLAYLHYWFAEEPLPGADNEIGNEINLTLTYDYTEDVQFLLDGAWFNPGDYYDRRCRGTGEKGLRMNNANNRTREGVNLGASATNRVTNDKAVSLIGSCKVSF